MQRLRLRRVKVEQIYRFSKRETYRASDRRVAVVGIRLNAASLFLCLFFISFPTDKSLTVGTGRDGTGRGEKEEEARSVRAGAPVVCGLRTGSGGARCPRATRRTIGRPAGLSYHRCWCASIGLSRAVNLVAARGPTSGINSARTKAGREEKRDDDASRAVCLRLHGPRRGLKFPGGARSAAWRAAREFLHTQAFFAI